MWHVTKRIKVLSHCISQNGDRDGAEFKHVARRGEIFDFCFIFLLLVWGYSLYCQNMLYYEYYSCIYVGIYGIYFYELPIIHMLGVLVKLKKARYFSFELSF